jgi:hypothetical protein
LILPLAGVIQFLPAEKHPRLSKEERASYSASMTEPTSIICPDADVPEKTLKVILSFFTSVKIGRPWFMDQTVPLLQSGSVEILRPPPELKPSGDFKALLADYRRWIRTSHDRGFDAFLAFNEKESQGKEATWEIRGELRHRRGRPDEHRTRDALKWHLFLHLAQEIEEEGREADELLRTLKEKDSPLKGVIEEEEPPGPLSDLPGEEDPLVLSEAGRTRVLEAWFSLFEEHLSGEGVLLTLSPGIFQHLSDTWEERGAAPAWTEMEFRVPDFSRFGLQELVEARGRFLHSREGAALKEAAVKFLKGHSEVSRERMEEIDLQGLTVPKALIRLRHFSLFERSSVHEIVRHLSGKTIGFIGKEHTVGE